MLCKDAGFTDVQLTMSLLVVEKENKDDKPIAPSLRQISKALAACDAAFD